jgi:D-alanyl-D-alanine carboxypeptidase (penicillin-binding protein 5/6)
MTVRPETWAKWHGPAAGSTMFLSSGENVSVANLLYGIVTLSGNDACIVLAEGISGSEQAFTERMNSRTAISVPRTAGPTTASPM